MVARDHVLQQLMSRDFVFFFLVFLSKFKINNNKYWTATYFIKINDHKILLIILK